MSLPASIAAQFRQLRERSRAAARTHPRLARSLTRGAGTLAVVVLVGAIWFVVDLQRGLPNEAGMRRIGDMARSTTVYDASDKLAFTIFEEQRIEVPLSEVSPHMVRALVAIEDQRFYEHDGFDLVRIAGAAVSNLRHGRVTQGGSTLTQQLARQSFLTMDRTVRRKLQELILAGRIERRYTKDQILELYLNKVYFGDGLYGSEAASRAYFGKHASQLSVAEAALLAGLVKSPSSYAPTVNLDRAIGRRNLVLDVMLDAKVIDRATWQSARSSKVVLHDTLRANEPHGQYFKEQVRKELVDRFGWQRVYQGGLRVFSTIDMALQEAAESATASSITSIEQKRQAIEAKRRGKNPAAAPAQSDPLQAALVALDPKTGHVRAMVGGRDFGESNFNRAVQARRQPGSAFKPFVYAAALEAGYTPATMIDHLDESIATLQGAWTPEDDHSSAASMSLRTALRTSSNRAAVRLLQQVGIPRTVKYARDMGVGDLPAVPSLALGSGEVTLQSLTAAYAGFANRGLVPKPLLVRRVEDREGQLLYLAADESSRAIRETTAFLMSSMMADVINAGTAARARSLGFTLPAAGKTGTTNDFHDAWFVGFTPKLVAGVWVGFDEPRTILPNGFAADVAVPLWANFMKAATRGDKAEWLSAPNGITSAEVCRLSGKLAGDGCRHVDVFNEQEQIERRSLAYTEYFARGTEPSTYCDLHPVPGFFRKITTIFAGGPVKPPPIHLQDPNLPPSPVATSNDEVHAQPVPPPVSKKKRGFWSRVFGVGRDEVADSSQAQADTLEPDDQSSAGK